MSEYETTKEQLEAAIDAALEKVGREVDYYSTRTYTPEEVYALLQSIRDCE